MPQNTVPATTTIHGSLERDGTPITTADMEDVSAAIAAAFTAAFNELPPADPEEAGALWNDEGVLKISAG